MRCYRWSRAAAQFSRLRPGQAGSFVLATNAPRRPSEPANRHDGKGCAGERERGAGGAGQLAAVALKSAGVCPRSNSSPRATGRDCAGPTPGCTGLRRALGSPGRGGARRARRRGSFGATQLAFSCIRGLITTPGPTNLRPRACRTESSLCQVRGSPLLPQALLFVVSPEALQPQRAASRQPTGPRPAPGPRWAPAGFRLRAQLRGALRPGLRNSITKQTTARESSQRARRRRKSVRSQPRCTHAARRAAPRAPRPVRHRRNSTRLQHQRPGR
jgi:hypothetical protein